VCIGVGLRLAGWCLGLGLESWYLGPITASALTVYVYFVTGRA